MHCRAPTASARSQRALPGLKRELRRPQLQIAESVRSSWNRKRQISVGTARLHPRASDLSGKCWAPREHQISVRTSRPTASSGWLQPRASDLSGNAGSLGTAGPQPRAPDLSGHCQASPASFRFEWEMLGTAWAPDLSAHFPTNCRLRISVALPGPQPQASVLTPAAALRTSTASSGSHCALPVRWDLALAGPALPSSERILE